MLDKERRGNHPHAIVHIAGAAQFAHTGINNRITGFAALPSFKSIGIIAPRKGLEFVLQTSLRQFRIVIEQLIRKFAPSQFREKFGAVIGFDICGFGFGNNARRTDFAPAQMRTKARSGGFGG